HGLYRAGGAGARAVAEELGPELLDARGEVDRPRLAARVFGDAAAVARLNARIHPLVLDRLTEWYRELAARGEPLGAAEAALPLGNEEDVPAEAVPTARRERDRARGLAAREEDLGLAGARDRDDRDRRRAAVAERVEHLREPGVPDALHGEPLREWAGEAAP